MKIVLSRKGFDSENGGVASPIMPDGSLVSLPIPRTDPGSVRYDRLRSPYGTLGSLVTDLTGGTYTGRDTAHVDPDLRATVLGNRVKGWRPIFGQAGAAQSHLAGAHVGKGDLFLFFGWFRRIEFHDGSYRYSPDARDLHVIFGWLQVDDVLTANRFARAQAPDWARYHVHFHNSWDGSTVYLARKNLNLPHVSRSLRGGGVFPRFRDELRLTAPDESRSVWQLPRCFAPTEQRPIFSYHDDIKRWTLGRHYCNVQTVAKGQEFVIDPSGRPGVMTWVRRLFKDELTHPSQ